MRRLLVILAVFAAIPLHAQLQPVTTLQRGQLVRVTMRAGPRYIANLDSLLQDTLVLHPPKPPGALDLRFGFPAIATLEVQTSHKGRGLTILKRAGFGLVFGSALGAVTAWAIGKAEVCPYLNCASAKRGAEVAGGGGFVIGLISGLSSPSEVWAPVALPGRPAPTPTP